MATKLTVHRIIDHTYYPVKGRQRDCCWTCGRPEIEHERTGFNVEHEYSYTWGCCCDKCFEQHQRIVREKKNPRRRLAQPK